jgi:hypothetical protein
VIDPTREYTKKNAMLWLEENPIFQKNKLSFRVNESAKKTFLSINKDQVKVQSK